MTKFENKSLLANFGMFVLAAYPVLNLYLIKSLGITYADIIGVVVLLAGLCAGKLSLRILPASYYIYWVWAAIQIYWVAGISGWSDYLPGGIYLTIFTFVLLGFSGIFNMDLLYKYMKIVFVFATILFFYQYAYFLFTREKISMLLPLGSTTSYGNMTYQELAKVHCTYQGAEIERFCSIFAEPSHFAQYVLLLLSIELFKGDNKKKLFTKFSLIIALVLLLIQSGAGLVGLGVLAVVKLIHVLKTTKNTKYYVILVVLIPIVFFAITQFLNSGSGEYVASRTEEFDNSDGDGGSARLFFGWMMFLDKSFDVMLFGSSRELTIEGWDKGGFFNGVTYVLILQGIIGLVLLLWFYISSCRKAAFDYIALAIVFLTISLIGATYCSPLMLIVTVAIVGNRYKNRFLCKT